MSLQGPSETLDALLGVRDFVSCWARETLRLKPPAKLATDSRWDDWQSLPALRHVDAASRDERGTHSMERIDRSKIPKALADGKTISADISMDPLVRGWLAQLCRRLGVGEGGFAKIYVSPQGGGFPVHFDPDHVFVVQCRGNKRWRVGASPAVSHPVAGGYVDHRGHPVFAGEYDRVPLVSPSGPVPAPSDDDLLDILLTPGDGLYVPPGTWHRACAEGVSVALSISPPRVHALALVQRLLEAQAITHPTWLADLDAARQHSGQHDVQAQLADALAQMAEIVRAADPFTLTRQWATMVTAAAAPPSTPTVEKRSVLVREAPLPVFERDGAFVFFGGGQEWSLPAEARPFVQALVKHERFEAADVCQWDPALRWRDARAMLEEFVAAGLLTIASE